MADAADPKTDEERKDEADTRQERACKGRKYKEMVETGAVTPRKERKVCILSAGWTLIKGDYVYNWKILSWFNFEMFRSVPQVLFDSYIGRLSFKI